jgi:hypothetical protein
MKAVFALLAVMLCFGAVQADPVSDAAYFVDGFLRGALAQEIGRVDDCLTDGDSIIADVGRLINDVEGGFDLLPLITDIGALLRDVPKSIQDCPNLPDTVAQTFEGWTKKISNPLVIGKIVIKALAQYRSQLVGDATGFLNDWKNGNFEQSGQELGDIPHVLFDLCTETPAKSVSITPADVGHFLDGFLTSALQSEITEVESCLKDADKLIDDLTKFVEDISGGFDLLPIIADLGTLFTDIPHSIEDCSDFAQDVDDVLQVWEHELQNPIVVAKIVYIALAKYEDRLKTDATSFVDDFKAGNYEVSGQELGDIPHVLFDLCPEDSFAIKDVLKY